VPPEHPEELLRTAAESVEVSRRLGTPSLNLHGTGLAMLARIRAVLRRSRATDQSYAELRYEEDSGRILYRDEEILLTPKATAMLKLFLQHPNRLYNRLDLYDLVWPYSSESDPRTVDAHIRMIRDKLGEAGFPIDDYLKTVWGRGYRWTEERHL